MKWTSHIDHEIRIALGITVNEYMVADFIYNMASNKKYDGWCRISNNVMSETFGIDRRNIIRIRKRLFDKQLIDVDTKGGSVHTQKWYDIVVLEKLPIHIVSSDEMPPSNENHIHIISSDETPLPDYKNSKNVQGVAKRHSSSDETPPEVVTKRHPSSGETSHNDINKLLSINYEIKEQAKIEKIDFSKKENEDLESSAPPPSKKDRSYKKATNRVVQIYHEEFQLAQGRNPSKSDTEQADLQTLINKIKEDMKLENEVVTEQSVELQFRGFLRGVAADQFMKDNFFSPDKLKLNYQIILTKIRNANQSKSSTPDRNAQLNRVAHELAAEHYSKYGTYPDLTV